MSLVNAARIFARAASNAPAQRTKQVGIVPSNAAYKRLQKIQSQMCRDDGLLVWQKMGTRDAILYQVSMAIVILGFIPLGYQIYKMAFPQKK